MISPLPFYVLRSTSLSLDDFFQMNDLFKSKNSKELKILFKNEKFLNAIYFSSRPFYHLVKVWLKEDYTVWNSDDKVLESLYKYYTRMSTRCTPYGLFSGFTTGQTTNASSNITLATEHNPIFRTDMFFIKKLKDEIIKNNNTHNLLYYPNNTITKVAKKIRYIEWDKNYSYTLSEVNNNFLLDKILQQSVNGLTIEKLIENILVELKDADRDSITSYVYSLLSSKLLVDALPPYMTSVEDPLIELENYLTKFNIETSLLATIKETLSFNQERLKISELETTMNQFQNILDDTHQTFQIDLKLNLTNNNLKKNIPEILVKETKEILEVLPQINKPNLEIFIKQFLKKFESREIPLNQAIDPQMGVGYGIYTSGNIENKPLIENIDFSFKTSNIKSFVPPIIKLVYEKYHYCFDSSNPKIIQLCEKDIREIPKENVIHNWAENYYLFGDLYAQSMESLDKGDFKFNCKGNLPTPYSLNILGRFAYHDPKLTDMLQKSLSNLDSNYIYAEIIHQPDDKLGNVLLRPTFYSYEIPYLSNSKKIDKIISINDIYVSIRNQNIILRSKSLNKEIRPRFSNAYNPNNSQLPIIQFLCDIQYQNIILRSWNWSSLNNNTYLPRVEYKHIILSEARWKLKKNKNCNISKLIEHLKSLNVNTFCVLRDGDNSLLLDIENEISLRILLKRIKKGDLYLFESFHKDHFISQNGKNHATEFIFPLQTQTTN
ncbi:MAG: lantibiotic dehydratase family protein [Flavobacterium sp.]|uniref:lantibiotic dehydratase family protein n=1 Tax=Flavobacterium sp. TaxID=239 RepID=UPI003266DF2A